MQEFFFSIQFLICLCYELIACPLLLNSNNVYFTSSVIAKPNVSTLQSLTGKYRGLQGNPCNENRDPAMRTGVPCNENRVFPVGIGLQGVPCKPYRVWVCSVFSLQGTPVLIAETLYSLQGILFENYYTGKSL